MATKKEELKALFNVVATLLRNKPLTLVMDNQGSTKGQLYTISKATHEQAAVGRSQSRLFSGTASETINYLQGIRDLFTDILPTLID